MNNLTRLEIREVLKSEHQWISLEGVPLVTHEVCACCGKAMETVGSIGSPLRRIRLGFCSACGYVGYLDRPADTWFRHYYDTVWDAKTVKTLETIKTFKQSRIVQVARELGIPTSSRVFEVGTGYGQLLRQFHDAGFASVFGIEHSAHRAELASRYAEATVFHGDFGHWSEQEEAKASGQFDVVYSKSVMEHMEEPRLLFQHASRIQPEGGWLIVAVPNVLHEPVTVTWLFLPHLHAFSAASLATIAASNGYQPVRVEEDGKGLVLVARKQASPVSGFVKPRVPTRSELMQLWRTRWAVTSFAEGQDRVFWWTVNDPNRTGVLPAWMASAWGLGLARRLVRSSLGVLLLHACFGVARRFGAMRMRVLSPAEKNGEVGLEIVMEELRMFVK